MRNSILQSYETNVNFAFMNKVFRILCLATALVFVICTVVQFHHHDDDGAMCMCLHTDCCNTQPCSDYDCSNAGQHLSQQHHHCPDTECSLHLSDTEIQNINNITSHSHNTHSHTVLCAVLCTCLSTFNSFESSNSSWHKIPVIGHITAIIVPCRTLRAPPMA